MDAEKELFLLLKSSGFREAPRRRHRSFKASTGLHMGKAFVLPSTPSDMRWARNALTDLRHVLAKSLCNRVER
jgi:hypothetical protein